MDGNIFDSYLSFCSPFRLAPPWDFVRVDAQAFSGPPDPAAALAALLAIYIEQSLIDSGIARPNANGCLEIHPFLSIPDAPIIALRDSTYGSLNNPVNNLMTKFGCVTGHRYPLFATLRDKHSYSAIDRTWPELILTGDLEDAILLRSLGFAAAPIVGVSELDNYGLHLLGRYFGVKRPENLRFRDDKCTPQTRTPAEKAAAQRNYAPPELMSLPGCHSVGADAQNFVTMTIANWSPKDLSLVEPPAIRLAVRYLRDLNSFRGHDLFDVNLWAPTSHPMASMKFALARHELGWAKRAIFDSLVWDKRSMAVIPENKPPIDMATAIEQLQDAFLHDSGNSDSKKRSEAALAAYQSVVQRDLLGPITQQTQAIADPFERAIHAQWADLYALFLEKMLGIREGMFAGLKVNPRNREINDKKGDPKNVSELLAISKQLLALTNRVLPCTKCKPIRKPASHTASSSSRRLGGSD